MDVQWQDMDKLIELHSEKHLFYGPRPTNHEDAFRKICIATGIDASAFAGGAKFPRHAKKTREARGLEEMSIISKFTAIATAMEKQSISQPRTSNAS